MDNILYKKAEKKDIIAVAKLVTELIGTCNLNENNSIIENNIKEITDSINHYYICEMNSHVVGACGISNVLAHDNYNLNLYNIYTILYLVVDKKYQGKGIGTTLLNLCCKDKELDIIYDAWGDNGKYVNSKFVLEKCGFELYKNLGEDYYKNHNYCQLCVNKDKQCESCLAQIWIKNGSKNNRK